MNAAEVLVVALDAPPELDQLDQAIEGDIFRQGGKPVSGWLGLALGPFDQQPLYAAFGQGAVAMGCANPHPREPARQRLDHAFAPFDPCPGLGRQTQGDLLDRGHVPLAPPALGPRMPRRRRMARREHQGVAQHAGDISESQGR